MTAMSGSGDRNIVLICQLWNSLGIHLVLSADTYCHSVPFTSLAHLLGAGLYHEDHKICQIHRTWHRPRTAALLPHWAAGAAVRPAARRRVQRHPRQGQCAALVSHSHSVRRVIVV